MDNLDGAWLEYEFGGKTNQYSKADFRQFVLNKTCPKCGSKIYWATAKREYICQTCPDQKLQVNEP